MEDRESILRKIESQNKETLNTTKTETKTMNQNNENDVLNVIGLEVQRLGGYQ